MRILILTGPTLGLVFPLVPLTWALRAAGHEVALAGPENAAPAVSGAGLPFVALPPQDITDLVRFDRNGEQIAFPHGEEETLSFMGHGFGRLAAFSIGGLNAFAARWQPDLVVGTTYHFAAPLLAMRLGVPWVNQAVEVTSLPLLDRAAAEELAPELAALGRTELPEPDLYLDTCPPSLSEGPVPGRSPARYVPFNTTAPLEPWMTERSGKPRVCVTLGSRITRGKPGGVGTLEDLIDTLSDLDAEILVAVNKEKAADLRLPAVRGLRAGWLPLDSVVPTCDAVVHHGGGNTMYSCLASGVPQLVLPYMLNNRIAARRLAGTAAAEVLEPGEDSAENILAACRELLDNPAHRARAGAMHAEIAAMPSPAANVRLLEKLVPGGITPTATGGLHVVR